MEIFLHSHPSSACQSMILAFVVGILLSCAACVAQGDSSDISGQISSYIFQYFIQDGGGKSLAGRRAVARRSAWCVACQPAPHAPTHGCVAVDYSDSATCGPKIGTCVCDDYNLGSSPKFLNLTDFSPSEFGCLRSRADGCAVRLRAICWKSMFLCC